jgi:hypothetical protein
MSVLEWIKLKKSARSNVLFKGRSLRCSATAQIQIGTYDKKLLIIDGSRQREGAP